MGLFQLASTTLYGMAHDPVTTGVVLFVALLFFVGAVAISAIIKKHINGPQKPPEKPASTSGNITMSGNSSIKMDGRSKIEFH